MDGVFLPVAYPNAVSGVAAEGVHHQELARRIGVRVPNALAAPSLYIIAILVKLMYGEIGVPVGDIHVPLRVVRHISGVVEGLAQFLQLMLEHPLIGTAVVAVAGLRGKNAVVHSHSGEHIHILDVVAGLTLLPPGAHNFLTF